MCLIIFLMPAVIAVIRRQQETSLTASSLHLCLFVRSDTVGSHEGSFFFFTWLRRHFSTGVCSGCEHKKPAKAKIHLINESLHMFLNGQPLARWPHISTSSVSRCFHPLYTHTHARTLRHAHSNWQTSQQSARKT